MKTGISKSLILLSPFMSLRVVAQETPKPSAEKARRFHYRQRPIVGECTPLKEGSSAGFGGAASGGARPQTRQRFIKTFGEKCPQVLVNNIQGKADYVVVLDHEGGKGLLRHKNKVAVFGRLNGDAVVSKSTLSLGGSVETACEAIDKDWTAHGSEIRAAALAAENKMAASKAPVAMTTSSQVASSAKISVVSIPDGADIEVDGSFVGNTPSDIDLIDGEHTVSIQKSGFKPWQRKIKVNSGSNVHLKAELEKSGS